MLAKFGEKEPLYTANGSLNCCIYYGNKYKCFQKEQTKIRTTL